MFSLFNVPTVGQAWSRWQIWAGAPVWDENGITKAMVVRKSGRHGWGRARFKATDGWIRILHLMKPLFSFFLLSFSFTGL